MIPAGLYLADTSALARATRSEIRNELEHFGHLELLATCVTVDLEVLYSARSPVDYSKTAKLRAAGFTNLPLNADIEQRARAIQARLATRSQHRAVGVIDLLTAAIAEHYAAIVLHYDSDFDHIAKVTGQQTKWIVPRGAVQ